jgi:hypothetical protein
MSAHRFNGECWYEDEGLPRRALKWVAWFGGWEAHSPKREWSLRRRSLRERLKPGMITPVSLFGHRITFFGWGWQLRLRGGYLVRGSEGRVYFSPDGTPHSATIWFKGAPEDVEKAAAEAVESKVRAA